MQDDDPNAGPPRRSALPIHESWRQCSVHQRRTGPAARPDTQLIVSSALGAQAIFPEPISRPRPPRHPGTDQVSWVESRRRTSGSGDADTRDGVERISRGGQSRPGQQTSPAAGVGAMPLRRNERVHCCPKRLWPWTFWDWTLPRNGKADDRQWDVAWAYTAVDLMRRAGLYEQHNGVCY